ncbi:OVARIAN TUMOR DOMAIN-containing deubiquitinating enzyme 1-like [Zingiber officinale]|uniref:OVARIAN TUMOR DOMAIN-containing deubiquitinating enzyme 1-like n=1 Tax=Zingiber officinale TaxID=94328 RepID=UPI001C4C4B2C|nr:OVARIAN TUMOR DOMAIN-containing deubiquitinating enzyme 1-like [Zingiber officinale]
MASPPEREPKRRNSPSDSDSVTASAASSTSGDASDSVSPEEQPSAPAASPTSVSQEPSDDDDASISDCGDSSLSSLGNGEYAESDDDSGYLGDKEYLSYLATEYESGNIIELLQDKYSRFRRAKGDDNCFFRAFMFAYLEHLLETQDKAQFDSAIEKVEQCRKTLKFGDPDYIAEDYFSVFITMLDCIQRGNLSHEELLWKSNYRYVSNYLVFFLKIVVSVELFSKAEFYKPFIAGFENLKLEKFCKSSVELMGECDQVRVKALTDALGVQLRIEHVVQSSNHSIIPQLQHHDYQPSASCGTAAADRPPAITLLHRCGRYYILYL